MDRATSSSSRDPAAWTSNVPGDVSGGVASAVVSITGNVAAGIIAFAPLGPDYVGQGIVAGMAASIVAGLVASVFGGAPGLIAGPKATTSMAFAAVLTQLIAAGSVDLAVPDDVRVVLTYAFMAVLLSGVAQVGLGAFRVGAMVKFIPYPVVAGIRNTTAVLLIYGQLWALLGVSRAGLLQLFGAFADVQPGALAAGITTIVVAVRGGRWMHKAAVPVAALLAGTAVHYGLLLFFSEAGLGAVLGEVPPALPKPEYFGDLVALVGSADFVRFLPVVLSGALAITVLDSVTALITLVGYQSMANQRFDANRQLLGQGLGSALSAAFGGLTASGIFARAATNYRAGGRTRLSGVVNSVSVLVLIVLLVRPLSFLPKSVIAGFILVVAFGLLDRWSLGLIKEVFQKRRERRQDVFVDLAQMGVVVGVGVAFNLLAAVAVGLVVSILVFVGQMSRSPIRRVRSGEVVRSRRRRDDHLAVLLKQHGARIAALELEGTIFFGSCDPVATELEDLSHRGARWVIVDMKRVRRIDTSGYHAFGQVYQRLRSSGVRVGFSYTGADRSRPELRHTLRVTSGVAASDIFSTTDRALEEFEEALLQSLGPEATSGEAWTAMRFGLEMGLTPEAAEIFASIVDEIPYQDGQLVCGIGDPGGSMYFVSQGSADITIPIGEGGRERRLATLTQGTLFGEMSLLDGKPRSADVRAHNELVCFEFSAEDMAFLTRNHAEVAIRVYEALGRILGNRLREANELITELDA